MRSPTTRRCACFSSVSTARRSTSISATVAAVDDGVRAFLAERIRNSDELLKKQIEKAIERGEIARSSDPLALAHLAIATLHTLAVRSRAGISRKELDALADAAIGVICGPAPG